MRCRCKHCGEEWDQDVKRPAMPPTTCLLCNPRRKYPRYGRGPRRNGGGFWRIVEDLKEVASTVTGREGVALQGIIGRLENTRR